jgi:lysozyme
MNSLSAAVILEKLIKEFDSCKLTAYQDLTGKWTCGYGETGPDIFQGIVWTQAYAYERLHRKIREILKQALDYSPTLYTATAHQQAAIADFIYNCGLTAYIMSKLKLYVDIHDWNGAKAEIMRWNKITMNGEKKVLSSLTKRRAAEAALMDI